jgi:hypothetical protein|tara:strand:- start:374 stop:673 length:300 start_codon:yes stop_codon:yes gene_type:complete
MPDDTAFIDSTATLTEQLLELGVEGAPTMCGFDDCVVGVLERFGMECIVIYDKEKVIEKLMAGGIPTYEEALEFYEYNQLGSWYGDLTPGFLIKLSSTS